jgi:hypothetical protein
MLFFFLFSLYFQPNALFECFFTLFSTQIGLTGKAEDIAEYERLQAESGYEVRRNDKGHPIFFTTKYAGKQTKVKITTNGNVVIDDLDMRRLASLAENATGAIQAEIAKQGVSMLMKNLFNSSPVAEESSDVEQSVEPKDADFEQE